MPPVRILFVDDEPSIRATTPLVLKSHGYDTTSVGTVAEALAEIAAHPFDVLISDLNMGEYGDGFTVVSAMRRTHPNCINFILTGYPALETALEVISRHVDEILVKPLPPPQMVAAIEQRLISQKPAGSRTIQTKRVADILHESKDEICQQIVIAMSGNPELAILPLSDEQRLDHIRITLTELVDEMRASPPEASSLPAASKTGIERYLQKYPIVLLAVNARLLQGVIYEVIQDNLLSVNLSYLMPDLIRLNEILSLQAEEIIKQFLEAEKRAA